MNVLLKRVVQRVILLVSSFILQIGVISFFLLKYSESFFDFYLASLTLSIIIVFIIINNKSNPSYKIAWIVPVMIFPIFGGLFYLLYGGNKLSTREKLKMVIQNIEMTNALKQDDEIIKKIGDKSIYAKNQSEYILNYAKCPVYNNTETTYFKIGEEKFEALLRELKKAEKFIFLEYFIIQEGKMFNSILEILEEKAKQGVDVRLIYDDVGCIVTLPHNYKNTLEAKGIKCRVFNPIKPFFTRRLNNRDHRKIVVIDGCIGYTGGINIGDEYIGRNKKFGYWRDTHIRIEGTSVYMLQMTFLIDWYYNTKQVLLDKKYFPKLMDLGNSMIQIVASGPDSDWEAIHYAYFLSICQARKSIYIETPYFIPDDSLLRALKSASLSGVDVRIIFPKIADHKIVNTASYSYFDDILKSGGKVYLYNKGFIHSKVIIIDETIASTGSANMDLRSFMLNFEINAFIYDKEIISRMKDDFFEDLKHSKEIDFDNFKNRSMTQKAKESIARLFSPIL